MLAFSLFLTMFSKCLFIRAVEIRDCLGKGWFKFKHIYFTSIEKQVLTNYTNLSQFCFLSTYIPVLAQKVWASESPG